MRYDSFLLNDLMREIPEGFGFLVTHGLALMVWAKITQGRQKGKGNRK